MVYGLIYTSMCRHTKDKAGMRPISHAFFPERVVCRHYERSRNWLFCVLDRLTPDTLPALHGVASQKTPHTDTPRCKRRPALIDRLVKHWVTQVELGPVCKRINPSWALGLYWFYPLVGTDRDGGERIEVTSIHPRLTYD